MLRLCQSRVLRLTNEHDILIYARLTFPTGRTNASDEASSPLDSTETLAGRFDLSENQLDGLLCDWGSADTLTG